ncbi:uncharacterized protein PAC_05981 [Phialocephala subalpina]|uniref:Uncharacterized protein n=1 Tax=Phialocephala subalpina TaxID=576137 RepID=A0A1L7WTM6_9HELO|nr:uncharacterized protein PAC_05981 [Phialocephala subalpina]
MPPDHSDYQSSVPPIIASSSNHPLAFVIVSHPTARQDVEVQSQVRRHVAYRWHEDSRRRNMAPRGRPRLLAQKAIEPDTSRQSTPASSQTNTCEAEDGLPRPCQPKEETALASSTDVLAFSPSPGPSPVTKLGGGRIDPFNGCAVRCNTMLLSDLRSKVRIPLRFFSPKSSSQAPRSYLPDFQTFTTKVSAIYTTTESAELQLQGITKQWVSFLVTDAGILAGVFLRACRTLSVVTSKAYLDKLALKYRARCIKALSMKIANVGEALSLEAVAMMLMLAADEFYMGSAEAMMYHVAAMQRVVKLKGGLQHTALEGIVLRLIEWNDLQCTLLAQEHGQPRRYPAAGDILTYGFPTFS